MHRKSTAPEYIQQRKRASREQILNYSRDMRLKPSPSELRMKLALFEVFRPVQVNVITQFIIGPYICDFRVKDLIIEVDGPEHEQKVEYDRRRTQYINNKRFRMVRFSNKQVAEDVSACAQAVFDMTGPHAEVPVKTTAYDYGLMSPPPRFTKCPPGSAIHGKAPYRKNGAFRSIY